MLGKPAASLSSGLLARKGHARPAMRPQGYVSLTPAHSGGDDLGWNDMGEEAASQPVAAPAPAPVSPFSEAVPVPSMRAPAEPPVLRQRAELDERLSPPVALPPAAVAPAPVPVEPAPTRVTPAQLARVAQEVGAGKAKAAFTLRLDTDRHLRLRLASAVRHKSAQQLVTEALDAFLETLTDVDGLARQLAARDGRD